MSHLLGLGKKPHPAPYTHVYLHKMANYFQFIFIQVIHVSYKFIYSTGIFVTLSGLSSGKSMLAMTSGTLTM